MKLALIGLPGTGKTTLFNALTGADEPVGTFSGGIGGKTQIVQVPDPRLEKLRDHYQPKKYTPATYACVDVTGLVSGEPGRAQVSAEAVGLVREMDALVHVARAFEDDAIPHVHGSVDPLRDLAQAREELAFADLLVAQKRVERLRVDVNKPTGRQEEDRAELAVLERVVTALEDGRPARSLGLTPEEVHRIRGFGFLTLKPEMVVFNAGEGAPELEAPPPGWIEAAADATCLVLCGKLEMEIAQLPEEDRGTFLEELGLSEPASARFRRAAYDRLGLQSFFTVGEDEVRAWTIQRGDTAVTAAGKIHTDLAKRFIRAEVVGYETFSELGDMKAVRAAGKLRKEGRDYVVADGDIINVLHNA